ncbi:MAG: response regulator [Ignavibacteriaceae bacterium]
MNSRNEKKETDLILVVDDQPTNLKLISTILSKEYSLSVANSGKMALGILENIRPDLILLDIMMPVMDGFEVCKRIKEREELKDIPVIFLTAKSDIDSIVEGFEFGAIDYITKPFNAKEVNVRIKNHINLSKAKRRITAQKREIEEHSEQLTKFNHELARINKEKDKFFLMLAHKLKSPFMGFMGISQIISEETQNLSLDEIKEFATALNDSANNIYRLLENLLLWSRLQTNSVLLNPLDTRIYQAADKAIYKLSQPAEQKELKISNNIPKDLIVNADSELLNTVFTNLLLNSIKFCKKGGEVEIDGKSEGEFAEIYVKDSGTGIPEDVLMNLFVLGEKRTQSGKENEGNTGLGLILCKDYLQRGGGEIRGESKEGGGATVYFTLPLGDKTVL